MKPLETTLMEQVKKDHEYIVQLRRHFHKYPELPKEEFETADKIEEELHLLKIQTTRVDKTGVYAEIHGDLKGDKVIVLRADIDALPVKEEHVCEYQSTKDGVMHACGHDAHIAGLIGAARILVKNKDKFGGTVRLIFQHAEEIGHGGRVFVNQGYLDGADRTFGIHMGSNIPTGSVVVMKGPNNASVDWFKVHVHGKSAHVSTPERGVDALYIASQIVVSLQSVITRLTSPMDPVLIGIGKMNAGTAYNVVADSAELEGTLRAMTPEVRKKTKQEIEKVCTLTAQSYGGTAEIEWKDFTSPLMNDEVPSEEVQAVCKRIFKDGALITEREPSLAGDDFAEFILKVSGCYAYVGSGNTGIPETTVAHHNAHFDIDEDSLLTSVSLYTVYAVEYLNGDMY